MCPPKEVLRLVVAIKPAKANKEMDKMSMDIKISINEKPSDFERSFKLDLHGNGFVRFVAKPIPMSFKFELL
jgi:hypothetical protein